MTTEEKLAKARELIIRLIESGNHVHGYTPCANPTRCRWLKWKTLAEEFLVK